MRTRTIVEDVPGNLNRRYFVEVDADDEVNVRCEGESVADAARNAVDRLRYLADSAERRFVEAGTLPAPGRR